MIKLSQMGDDALKALCYIADNGGTAQIHEIAKSQGMSELCLRRIIPELHRAGILNTKK